MCQMSWSKYSELYLPYVALHIIPYPSLEMARVRATVRQRSSQPFWEWNNLLCRGTPYNGPYEEAPPERYTLSRPQVL